MQPHFWLERWQLGQIGFHQTAVEQQLERLWRELQVTAGSVFVPLCGKSLDLLWLRDRGLKVTGVEISPVALELLCLEQGIPARRQMGVAFERYTAEELRLFQGDLFDLNKDMLGPVDAVYDRASMISFTPQARPRYVEQLAQLTERGTKTLLITLEYPQQQMDGPPFSVSAADVENLYGSHHTIRLLSRRDILGNEPRLRSRGVSELYENCFLLTRQ